MKTLAVGDMRERIDDLIEAVESGERVDIMRDSQRIATVQPEPEASAGRTMLNEVEITQMLEEMSAFAKGNRLEGLSIRDLVNEGRKW